MNIAICAIARLENRYIKEWVDYHLSLGFSHIYIYDNNRDGEERISEVLDVQNIYKNSVTIIPYHNVDMWPQMQAYNDCYNRFEFDWLAYIDIDEFFTFNNSSKYSTISDYLKEVRDKDAVLINWVVYGDNGECHYRPNSVVSRFNKSLPLLFSVDNIWGKQPINGTIKSVVRSGISKFKMNSPHVGSGVISACNSNFEKVENVAYQPCIVIDNLYIRHYITKSFDEYTNTKGRRPTADGCSNVNYSISSYFKYNRPTIKKCILYYRYCRKKHIKEEFNFGRWFKLFIKFWLIVPFLPKYQKKM